MSLLLDRQFQLLQLHREPIPDREFDDKVRAGTDKYEATGTDEDPKAGNSLWFEEED